MGFPTLVYPLSTATVNTEKSDFVDLRAVAISDREFMRAEQ